MNKASNLSFSLMKVQNSVAALTAGIYLVDTTGTVAFSDVLATGTSGASAFNAIVHTSASSTAAITMLTVTNGAYNNSASNGGFLVDLHNTASIATASFTGVTFSNNYSKGLQIQQNDNAVIGNSVGTVPSGTLTVSGCTFTNNDVAASFEGGAGTGGTGSVYYRFVNNLTITGSHSVAVNFANGSDSGGGTYKAFISGNNIGTAGVANSGSAIGEGLRVFMQGQQVATVTILNNVIRDLYNGAGGFDARGIDVQELGRPNSGFGQTALDVKIVGNDVNQEYTGSASNIQYAIYVAADAQGTGTSGSSVHAEIHGNTVPASHPCDSECSADTGMIVYETVSGATGTRAGTLFNFSGVTVGNGNTVSKEIANNNTGTSGDTCAYVNGGTLTLTGTVPNTVN